MCARVCVCGGKAQSLDLFDIFECETQSGFCGRATFGSKRRVLHVADHVSEQQRNMSPSDHASQSQAQPSAARWRSTSVEIYRMQRS